MLIIYRNLWSLVNLAHFITFTMFWFFAARNILTLCICQWIWCLFWDGKKVLKDERALYIPSLWFHGGKILWKSGSINFQQRRRRRLHKRKSPFWHFPLGSERDEQCDQIGLFFKSLGYKFSYKRSPKVTQLFGLFWKTAPGYFWTTFSLNLASFGTHFH